MNRKILLPILVILICSVLISQAQKSRSAMPKSGSNYIKYLSTSQWSNYSQGQADSGIRFTLVWKGAKPPETFFWRPKAGGWMTCEVTRVHTRQDRKNIFDQQYDKEIIDMQQVHKGDTLEIAPIRGGRDIMPRSVPVTMTNKLFFMVSGNSSWWYVTATSTKKK